VTSIPGEDRFVIWAEFFNGGSLALDVKPVRLGENVRRFNPTELVLISCGFVLGGAAVHARADFDGNLKPSDVVLHSVSSELNVRLSGYIAYSLKHYCNFSSTELQLPGQFVAGTLPLKACLYS
jgi:hypothetical protein